MLNKKNLTEIGAELIVATGDSRTSFAFSSARTVCVRCLATTSPLKSCEMKSSFIIRTVRLVNAMRLIIYGFKYS